MKLFVFFIIFSYSFFIFADEKEILHYYKLRTVVCEYKTTKKEQKDFFKKIVAYIKKYYEYQRINFYEESFIISILASQKTHYDLYVFLRKDINSIIKTQRKISLKSNVPIYNYYESINKDTIQKKIELVSALFESENVDMRYHIIKNLIRLQGIPLKRNIKLPEYYRILKMRGTDNKEYICFIGYYMPENIFRSTYTYLRFIHFDNFGNLCGDAYFPFEKSIYVIDKVRLIDDFGLNILLIESIYSMQKNSKHKSYFLVNKHGFYPLKNEDIPYLYLDMPTIENIKKFLFSKDVIKNIVACNILLDFNELSGNTLIKKYLETNKNPIIRKLILQLLKK